MTAAAYAELLDWTARQVRGDKRGATPADLPPLFERLQIDERKWVKLVGEFGKLPNSGITGRKFARDAIERTAFVFVAESDASVSLR